MLKTRTAITSPSGNFAGCSTVDWLSFQEAGRRRGSWISSQRFSVAILNGRKTERERVLSGGVTGDKNGGCRCKRAKTRGVDKAWNWERGSSWLACSASQLTGRKITGARESSFITRVIASFLVERVYTLRFFIPGPGDNGVIVGWLNERETLNEPEPPPSRLDFVHRSARLITTAIIPLFTLEVPRNGGKSPVIRDPPAFAASGYLDTGEPTNHRRKLCIAF